MKRCFYISNSYDGAYFVLTDSIDEFAQRMTMYMANLKRSGKCNHYSFGSVEMTEREYLESRDGAGELERSRIQERTQEEASRPSKNQNNPFHLV